MVTMLLMALIINNWRPLSVQAMEGILVVISTEVVMVAPMMTLISGAVGSSDAEGGGYGYGGRGSSGSCCNDCDGSGDNGRRGEEIVTTVRLEITLTVRVVMVIKLVPEMGMEVEKLTVVVIIDVLVVVMSVWV